ncbi:sensor histidine kinase [Acetonema longum]|uniref:histidine kinase n=1 Tax=Acetonema longum DSM 6540 TaxID=1009370 RepID=F7NH01_9FIRM|nr:ATP-binding protein [Acetonema longum]EGO64732.1 integral membrane sensor signal transduction histidine kinase [Acetonema longum DSM 6540]
MLQNLRIKLIVIHVVHTAVLLLLLLFITATCYFSQTNALTRMELSIIGIACLALSTGCHFFLINRFLTPLQQIWQQQKDFVCDASHEVRTPLTVILTHLDIIMANSHESVASQTKWLNNIREEALSMSNLVRSLLFLARADSQQQPLDPKSFFLHNALLQAATPFEPVAARKGVSFNITAATPVAGYGDEAKIKQVIAILLDNAIRHTPAGGKVDLTLSQESNQTILTVADSGEGIASEHFDKIFDRFYQVDKARSKGGSGLGLAIAKWIVENHGGFIQVASIPGAGTTFTVHFPWR